MYLMGMLGSSTARGFKVLKATFEGRKLKSEPGENVARHTIKVRNDFRRLSNANVPMDDALLTVIDNMVECTTNSFNIWASTKRIAITAFLKENMGKSALVKSQIKDAPTVEGLCDDADEYYLSIFESGEWKATESKRDSQAVPTAFLLEKVNKALDRLSINHPKKENTCWTCGKAGHRSPQCPDGKLSTKSGARFAPKSRDRRAIKPTGKGTWQTLKPGPGESETIIKDDHTFYWCDLCSHWRTTHGTSGHTGGAPSRDFPGKSKSTPMKTTTSANLAGVGTS
jgi:hypothetical protein